MTPKTRTEAIHLSISDHIMFAHIEFAVQILRLDRSFTACFIILLVGIAELSLISFGKPLFSMRPIPASCTFKSPGYQDVNFLFISDTAVQPETVLFLMMLFRTCAVIGC